MITNHLKFFPVLENHLKSIPVFIANYLEKEIVLTIEDKIKRMRFSKPHQMDLCYYMVTIIPKDFGCLVFEQHCCFFRRKKYLSVPDARIFKAHVFLVKGAWIA